MAAELSPIDKAKFVAAKRAVDFVEDGMRLGLGTGSTAAWMVRCLGELVREEGLKVTGVPTSTPHRRPGPSGAASASSGWTRPSGST